MMFPPPPQVDTDDDLRVTNNRDSAITDVECSIWKPPAVPSGMVGLKLKEKIAKGKFVDYDFSNFMYHSERYSKNPTMRLRDLDSIRLHNPVSEEISLLNLSSYRMNINNLNDVLYLCGGLVGMRFTSDELLLVLSKTKRLVSLWDALDECYKAMDPSCRKLIVQISDLKSHCEGGMCSDSKLYVTKFHMLADEYVQELADVQSMVRMKQSSIDPSDSKGKPYSITLSTIPYSIRSTVQCCCYCCLDNQLRLDADPESKIGTKAPVWLSTLIELYERSRSTVDTDSHQQSRRKLNVAEFSIYLADYILSGGRQATAVSDSLSEVHFFLGFL